MSANLTLTQSRIRSGVWEGILSGNLKNAPLLRAFHFDRQIDDPEIAPVADQEGNWAVRLKIPPECLNEGVQTFVIEDRDSEARLAHFSIVAGPPVDDDLISEVSHVEGAR